MINNIKEKLKKDDKSRNTLNCENQSVSFEEISKRILSNIDEYCVKTHSGGHRWHLGASIIGDDCSRKLWYTFRWVKHEKHTGRQYRLFNRGHREESRFIEWLEGIGAKVWADDLNNNTLWFNKNENIYKLKPSSNLEYENLDEYKNVSNDKKHIERAKADGVEFSQFRISGVNGHFGGSLDGIAILPENYGVKEPVLLEFKTNGTGKGFADLKTNGLKIAKPQHFAQVSTYGAEYGFNYVLYLNICKNDDDLHVEIEKIDHELGNQMKLKAEQIIKSNTPPPKLSENQTFYKCKWCHFSEICHKGARSEINCRSCSFAIPAENSEWFCSKYNSVIPRDFVVKACQNYKDITQDV